MEIRKSLISAQNLASLLKQREITGVVAGIGGIPDRLEVGSESAGRGQAPLHFDPGEIRSALRALEEGQACSGQHTQKDTPVINNRARQALDAYAAQLNLVRDDARSTLRQLLGVDYYA